ncbi:hypothetical protein Golomagni_00540 [Golovinomyces magnicellulatus]|nr:hypothetical protein Golomagni_00540 [Golovinomyces magnicellulatus]
MYQSIYKHSWQYQGFSTAVQDIDQSSSINQVRTSTKITATTRIRSILRRNFDEGVYEQLPPVDVSNEKADPRLTRNFTKLIHNGYNFLQHCKGSGARSGQFAGLVPHILDGRVKDFFRSEIGTIATFAQLYLALKDRFETITQRDNYRNEWNLIKFEDIKRDNPDKTTEEAIDVILNMIRKCRKALGH